VTLLPKPVAEELRAQAPIEATRGELQQADTPAEVNRARLKANLLCKALEAAVKSGGTELAELHREAQVLHLEAAVTLGEKAIATDAEGPHVVKGRAFKSVASAAGMAPTSLRRLAVLALARRLHEAAFDALVVQALDAGKPVPLAKLRALAKGPPEEDADEEEDDEVQIAFRADAELLELIDEQRQVGRTISRTTFTKRAVEAFVRPRPADGRAVFQRALRDLEFAERLREKVAFAEEEAHFLAERFANERAYQAIASALAGALDEAEQLAPPPDDEPEEELDDEEDADGDA
jgi:hypothetical protein